MIFLSHNFKDKAIVEPIAVRLSELMGKDEIFYDSWSIQPGDGIIDKMNEGLENCRLCFFFVSRNSLDSYMVKLEWQNVVMKMSRGSARLVPVRIDNCILPPILMQTLYIDLYTFGFDVALRQIVDMAMGDNTFRPTYTQVSNIEARTNTLIGRAIEVEISAKYYMEPISHFLFATPNTEDEISFSCKDCSFFGGGFSEGVVRRHSGEGKANAVFLKPPEPLIPGFPFTAVFKALKQKEIVIISVWHEEKKEVWKPIPLYVDKETN